MAVSQSIYIEDEVLAHLRELAAQLGESLSKVAGRCIARTTLEHLLQDAVNEADARMRLKLALAQENRDG